MAGNSLLNDFQASQKRGSGNSLLDDFLSSQPVDAGAIAEVTGKPAARAPSLASTIEDPNSLDAVMERRDYELGTADRADPNASNRRVAKIDRDEQDAAYDEAKRTGPVDSWSATGRKIVQHIAPGFKGSIGGIMQSLVEGAAGPPTGAPLTTAEYEDMKSEIDAGMQAMRERGEVPGQAMHDAAAKDMQENAFNPGDSKAKYYAGMFADSMIQMAPVLVASIATRGAGIGAAITGLQVGGQQYGDSRQDGRAPIAAAVDSLFMGTAEAVGERITLGMLMKPGGKFLKRAAKQVVGESVQEMGTQVLQTGYDMGILNPDMTWSEAVTQVKDAGIVGGLMGGGMSVVEAPFHRGEEAATPAPATPYDRGVNTDALNAFSPDKLGITPLAPALPPVAPDGKANVPLTESDIASPLDNALIQQGKNAAADALGVIRPTVAAPTRTPRKVPPAGNIMDRLTQVVLGIEGGGTLTSPKISPKGAEGPMQVMPGTNADPGFGVRPAQNDSQAERARVGRDYLAAMLRRYGNDPAKAMAAYNAGPGALDAALKNGADWLDHMPAETRKYVLGGMGKLGGSAYDEEGSLLPVPESEVSAVDMESADDFVKRVLGEDFFDTATPATDVQADAPQVGAEDRTQLSTAQDIRGPAINDEWTAFNPETSGTLNIPRSEMPQVKAEHRGAMVNFLKARGIASEEVTVPAGSLRPTQSEFSESKVAKAKEFTGGDRAILISSDGYIVDGHHQWLAKVDAGQPVRAIQLQAPIEDVLNAVHDFPSSSMEDTAAPSLLEDFTAQMEGSTAKRTGQYRDRSQDTESDLLTFIAANGGVRDDEGHNLRGLRNLQRPVAGLGSLIRKDGKSIDMVRERMVEAGWLPDGATVADALELIDRANFRPVYHPQSDKFIQAQTASLEPEGEARSRIAGVVEQMGLETFGPKEMAYALENASAGMDTETAIWSAMDRALSEDPTLYGDAVATEETYVPGFDPERDTQETRPEQAPGSTEESDQQSSPIEGAPRPSESAPAGRGPSNATLTDTASGRGITVSGATDEELEAINTALPGKASGVKGKTGWTYSKKHEDKIRAALETSAPTPATKAAGADSIAAAAAKMPKGYKIVVEGGKVYQDFPDGGKGDDGRVTLGDADTITQAELRDAIKAADDAANILMPFERAAFEAYKIPPPPMKSEPMVSEVRRLERILRDGRTNGSEADDEMLGEAIRQQENREKSEERKTAAPKVTEPVAPNLAATPMRETDKKNLNPYVRKGEKYRFNERIDYLGGDPNQTYTVDSASKNGAYFVNDVTDGRSDLRNWQIMQALSRGALVKVGAEPSTAAAPAAKPKQFTGNTVFTADKVEAARARLKAKLSGTTINSGVDPELLIDGMTIAGAYIESGVRKFADVAKALSADLGQSMSTLKPYLRAWYNGSRDMLEDAGQDVSDMDGPGAVRAALTMIEDSETRAEAPAAVEPTQGPADTATDGDTAIRSQLANAFSNAFGAGRAFASITEARAFAAETIGRKIEPGTADAKMLDESIEAGVIDAARRIVARNENEPAAAYRALVDLYGRQPKLSVRTSISIEQQAYSTPVPLAYLASRLAGINQNTTVYEPSAGNGALLIDARATYVTANELNPDRAAQLRAFLPGGVVTENDATTDAPAEKVDAVIANPPFGPVKGDDGQSIRFQVDDRYSTNEIDHAIALKSLEAMKDNGRAVLIIGGLNKTITDPKKRSDAYNGKAKREFFFTLQSQYNVTDHFTVDGSLYERQGAGWPVDVIVIEGRGKSSIPLPAVKVPRQYASWDALSEVLNNGRAQTAGAIRAADGVRANEATGPATANERDTGQRGERGLDRRAGSNTDGQRAPIRPRPADGQSERLRVDAERPAVVEAAGDQQLGGVDGRDSPRVAPEVAENDKQVTYTPGSGGGAMGTLVPVNMQNAVAEALDDLAERREQIDGYVADRLGYGTKDLYARFGAEQIDAIALAIDNIERGAGFIIGDQTGIGKGRVVAAVIRYAIRQKLNPIFVTEKPNLYADMYRDMTDIGMKEMLGRDVGIAMTNSGQSIPLDEDGKQTLKSSGAEKHKAFLQRLAAKGMASEGMDVLFTTYSQMQTVQGKVTERQTILRQLAAGGVLILDESHNAGGTGPDTMKKAGAGPNRAEFVRELVGLAKGVFYSSATYAKRPDVMDLYAATDMRLAVDDLSRLGEAIAKGGVPMQQVVAAMLARAGQYIRRERSFDGIAYNTPTVEIDRGQYSDASTVLKAIQDFSETHVSIAVETMDEELKGEAEKVGNDNATGEAGASSTNFTSIMHNVIDQMLLAFKADAAADRVIASIKAGEKPVVTVANTLESFLSEYAEDAGVVVGEPLDITFADVFRRYLERSRIVTIKKPFMKEGEKGEKVRLTDAQLGPAGVAAFREAMEIIGQSDLDTLPGSPLDHIIGRVQDAGYKIAEVTGRTLGLDYREGGAVLKARGSDVRSVRGRINAIRGFNDGSIDAILLNRSGSTGLSLHASEKFKDKRKRRMIIAQAEGNIDTHMQMLGRVHRTGQVVLPEYDQLVGGVPAEKRPAAVLAKKMASLNANTTASRDSALTSKEVLDFMNEYGDLVASRLMSEEPDIHEALGHPLKLDSESYSPDGAARRVTGRIPLLPVDVQEEVYRRIEEEYAILLQQKEAAGENALEAKTYDYQAITEATEEAVAPVPGSTSPFADGVYVERVSVKRLGKPFPAADVVSSIANNLDENVPEGTPAEALAALVRASADQQGREVATNYQQGQQYIREMEAGAKVKKAGKKDAEKLDNKALERLKADAALWQGIRQKVKIGAGIRLKTDAGNLYGIVSDVFRNGKSKNPLALGSWRMEVALVDAARSITLPFSQIAVDTGGASQPDKIMFDMQSSIGMMPIIEAFDSMQSESREPRAIATGNLLKAFDYVDGRGAIINYTTEDGTVKQGIMLNRGFDLKQHQANMPVALATPKIVVEYLSQAGGNLLGQGRTGAISAMAIPQRNTFILTAAKSKAAGGEFFQNKALIAAMGEQFTSKSSGMVSTANMDRAEDAVRVLLESGVKFVVAPGASPEAKEQARAIIARYAPEPAPQRAVVDAKAAVSKTATAPETSDVSVDTFNNWRKSVDVLGTVKGWTVFNDDVGGGFVLMNREKRVGPFVSEQAARQWAGSSTTPETLAPETAQPERTMTQRQRAEIDARQQQGMARRGGQASIKDQDGGLFGADRDQDSMFSRADGEAAEPQDFSAVSARLFDQLKRLGIADRVTLQVVERLFNDTSVAGSYQAGVIRVALAAKQSPDYTFDHEVIHALRDLGLFKSAEWTALVKVATGDTKIMERVKRLYPDLTADQQAEEAVSELFATWREGRRASSGFARQAMQRIIDLFAAIRRAITGGNLRDEVDAILRSIDNGEVGPRDPDGPGGGGARQSRVGDAAKNLIGGEATAERLDTFRTNLQDRMLPLLRQQQRITLDTGKALDEGMDAYLQEELMSGKVGARLERMTDDLVNPMYEQMRAEGITPDELEMYLYARHAPERNARISSINEKFREGTGSGMTDAEAASILERADVEGKIAGLERVAEKVDAILKFGIDTRVDAGLLSQEEADAWREQYQFYVPLRGEAEIEPESGAADRPRAGSGINVRGAESKRAFGRESKASNILAYSLMQAEEAVIRAGRNEVAQAFYKMVQANPDPDFWTIAKVTRKPVWNKATGTVSYRISTNIDPLDQDVTISLKIDGKEKRVTMNRKNPRAVALAKAMRNLNGVDMGLALQTMAQINRWLSTVNTGLNPEFIISNAFRDIQTAGVNLAGFDTKGLQSGTIKDYRKALVASTKGAFKKGGEGEWAKWYNEFVEEGGRIYFNQMDDLNDVRRRIEGQFAKSENKTKQAGMDALGAAKRAFEHVQALNTGIENAIRLSAYKNARERGFSKAHAASLAKNLTVNFNRRGAWGTAINSMYLFYNASVQGSARLLQAMFTKGKGGRNVRRILYASMATGFALEMLNMMMTGDDDDGESFYDKIPDFEKSRNLIVMWPNGKDYTKIPLPYGYNVFFSLGRSVGEVSRGRRWQDTGASMLGTIIDAFNPIGGTSNILNLVAPTLVDPAVDLVLNKDYAGRPIRPEDSQFGATTPESAKYWGEGPTVWKPVTDAMNWATGGDAVLPGAVDVSPENLEYLWGVGTGAAGQFVMRNVDFVAKALSGEEMEANDFPMVRKVVGSKAGWYDKAAYYARRDQIKQIAADVKEYREKGMDDQADAYEAQNEVALTLQPDVKRAEKAMRALRKERGRLEMDRGRGDIDRATFKAGLDDIKEREKVVVSEFNGEYMSVIEKPVRP